MPSRNLYTYELYLDVRSAKGGGLELLQEFLCSQGVPYHNQVVEQRKKGHRVVVYCSSGKELNAIWKRLKNLPLKHVHLGKSIYRSSRWQDAWKRGLTPFCLASTFTVVPSEEKSPKTIRLAKGRIPIFLSSTLTFGTGLHSTTRFIAEFIERCQGKFESFLDVGTGTGILSIVAHHCGAQKMVALDIEAESVATAKKNIKVNHIPAFPIQRQDFIKFKSQPFELVAANLISHDLMALAWPLVRCVRPGKYLAISGISVDNMSRVRKIYRGYPLRCVKILKDKQWAALLFQRLKGGQE